MHFWLAVGTTTPFAVSFAECNAEHRSEYGTVAESKQKPIDFTGVEPERLTDRIRECFPRH